VNRVLLQPGFVLHHRPYRNTSLLVEAYTLDHGRLGFVARGARRARSPMRGLLQPFRLLSLSWSGTGELHPLTGVEPQGPCLFLGGKALLYGFYLNELVLRLLQREDPHPEVFQLYGAVLGGLAQGTAAEPLLRQYEVQLLAAVGYGLVLDRDVISGEAIDPKGEYLYLPDQGPTRSDLVGAPQTAPRLGGRCLLALARLDFQQVECAAQIKRLMRLVLQSHLGPRPLESRKLFRELYSDENMGDQTGGEQTGGDPTGLA
jgi:DNA repair protein RecO (recombination protein O)